MGTSHSGAELARKLHALGTATERKQRAIVEEGSLVAKTIMLATASARGMTPGSKIAGRRWNVRYDVKGTQNPVGLVRFTGPFHLVDRPTDPHFITAKKLGARASRSSRQSMAAAGQGFGGFGSRGGAKALTIGGNFRATAFHPGTKGKRIFPAAKVIVGQKVPKVMAHHQTTIWKAALR